MGSDKIKERVSRIVVSAAPHRYLVLIGPRLLGQLGECLREHLRGKTCAIICDTNVGSLFAGRVKRSLTSVGFKPMLITIPAGEKSKTLKEAGTICEQMIAAGLDRQSFVVGLGGGVIGDISGFVAAIFGRGIPHVQIPTTLLAMVDSSIGGKTGVNAGAGKNLIGAIHQPTLVIDDVDILKTLPPRELSQGFAEIIKHAIIADAEMFRELSRQGGVDLKKIDFAPLIRRNVEIKARIIANDERDQTDERALLNFGHTVGHGIERAVDYEGISHGEALSIGIVAACAISMKKAGLPGKHCDAVVDLLRKFELPVTLLASIPRDKIFGALKFDKKFERGEIRFVVTPKIGSAYLSRDVTMDDIREAVDEL